MIKLSQVITGVVLVCGLIYTLIGWAAPALNDPTISAVVKNNLVVELELKAAGIYVKTLDGIVTLNGTVATADDKYEAEWVTRSLAGVTEVINNISINSAQAGPDHPEGDHTR